MVLPFAILYIVVLEQAGTGRDSPRYRDWVWKISGKARPVQESAKIVGKGGPCPW